MPLTYEHDCPECGYQFEVSRQMADRNKPADCPVCKFIGCPRVYRTAPRVKWFPGSYTYDDRADKLDRMAKEAQAEGFRSKGEVEAAVGQAHERAAKLGIPVERILGGTKASMEGEVKVDPKDAEKHKQLYQKYMEAGMLKQDVRKAAAIKQELTQFENQQAKKHAGQRKHKIKDREKDIKVAKSQQKDFQHAR